MAAAKVSRAKAKGAGTGTGTVSSPLSPGSPGSSPGSSFLSECAAQAQTSKRCALCIQLEILADEQPNFYAEVVAVLNNPAIPATQIHRALHNRNISLPGSTVQAHRRSGHKNPQ